MAKLIRKQPWTSKLKSIPFDLLLWFNELRLSIEWDDFALSLALPLGISLCIVQLILQSGLNYYDSISVKSNNVLFNSDYIHYEQLKSNLYQGNFSSSNPTNSYIWLLKLINNGLFIISLIHSYILFTDYKEYGLLYLKKNDLQTPSIFKRSLKVGSLILSKLSSIFIDQQLVEENSYDDDIWMLKVWQPLKFSLYLFVAFNPINLGIISTVSISLHLIMILALISGQFYLFIYKFLNLLNDKAILNQELMKEYTNKFVKPFTNKLKKDAQIDSTKGPYHSTVMINPIAYAFNKLKLFRTHDLQGNEIQEYVKSNDDDEFVSFEEYTSENLRPTRNRLDSSLRYDNSFNYSRNNSMSSRNHSSFSRNNLYFDENISEDDSDSDNWYISSTPYRRRYNPQTLNSRSHSPFKSPTLKPKSVFNSNPSPHHQRIPTLNTTPLLHKSPVRSPIRSPNRSPSRTPSPIRSPTRSFGRSSLASSREHSPNRTYMRSPSPVKKFPSQSPRPWR